MEGADTASLRNAAPQWSLAGDKQLLDVLQNIHQSLMTRCQEVNRKLDEMVTALDDASVDLQNVNNKFMALSNTQFIESRVYDDDTDVASQEKPKEEPKVPSSHSELELLKQSVRVLESMHEPIQILDSDSDSDTDDEITRIVLKPKDLYSDRPLPHIIGSAAWRNKWHAGLLPEDSDSDSSTSKPMLDLEEYSDSEPEQTENVPSELRAPHMQASSTSSEVTIEQDISSPAPPKPSPADIAAELARRLGQPPAQIVQPSEFSPATPTTRKIYRPEQPPAATIFSDEPPPLNQYQSEGEEYSQDEDDDIFAEFHKNTPQQPYVHSNKEQSRLAADLFSGLNKEVYGESDIFNDFKDPEHSPPPAAKQKSTLFEDESEPELFAAKPTKQTPKEDNTKTVTDGVKKPVGGISLFGSNKGAESIGAAILRRNRRKSSSDEDSNKEVASKPVKYIERPVKNTEKDIFDDLFSKSEKEKIIGATNKNKENVKVEKVVEKEKKVDLFSDNIFDDIDDIFTTDVSKVNVKESNKNQKSLFDDDDDDDLFSDIGVTKSEKLETKSKNNEKKGLFDSDDDLFSEKPVKNVENKESHKSESDENRSIIKTAEVKKISKSRSIFDDDNSDNDIFSNLAENSKTSVISNEIAKSEPRVTESQLNKEQNHKTESLEISKVNIINSVEASTSKIVENVKSHSVFDDDEDDDIINKKSSIEEKPEISSVVLNNEQNKKNEINNKTSIFDDDDDDIFASKSSSKSKNSNKVISIGEKSINNDFKDDELFTESNEISKKSKPKDSLLVDIKSDDILDQTHALVKQDGKEIEQTQKAVDDQERKEQNDEHFSHVKNKFAHIPIIESSKEINSSISNDATNQAKGVTPNQLDDSFESFVTKPESKSIFDDDLEDKLFNQEQTQDKYVSKPELPEADFDEIDNNKDNNENEALFSSQNESLFNTSSIISNILDDEPPAFEKPKERKKSKNINALFDDDSDDETLFFKKNDALFDDKPEISTDSNNDALFDIFHDEPPAIDVDFTQKPTKLNLNDDFLKTDSDDDLFNAPKTVVKESSKPSIASKPSQSLILEKEPPEFEASSKIPQKITKLDNSLAKIDKLESPSKETQKSDVLDGSNEPKKIGKLKSMNLNINVNTLLPGASPKKKQIIEQTDGQVFSAKSQEDLHSKEKIKEKIEPVLTKSVSFEGEPDSKVLDNKISKERAKIQVKRRPSTRRARQEAVRKSAIDFGEDSTDNSSSIDDPPKVEIVETLINDELDRKEIENEITAKLDEVVTNINICSDFESNINTTETSSQPIIHDVTPKAEIVKNNKIESINVTTTILTSNQTEYENKTKENLIQPSPKEINTKEIEPKTEEIKDVKSKIVYILTDEDIFNTGIEKTIETQNDLSMEDDDGLFKKSGNTSKDELPSISTLGNVYKDDSKLKNKVNSIASTDSDINKPKKSLFDDLSDDEELFNKKKPKSKGILDSDSEEDLFGGNSKKDTKIVSVKETKDVKPKVEVKASLFDDDDDDGLFGVKVKSSPANTSQPSKSTSKEVLPKSTEPVFDDPLSLLGDIDD